jgi:hypothetical protein
MWQSGRAVYGNNDVIAGLDRMQAKGRSHEYQIARLQGFAKAIKIAPQPVDGLGKGRNNVAVVTNPNGHLAFDRHFVFRAPKKTLAELIANNGINAGAVVPRNKSNDAA